MFFFRAPLRHIHVPTIRSLGLRHFQVSKPLSAQKNGRWTQQEVDTLVQLWKQTQSITEVCAVLCRPSSSVYHKLKQVLPPLGIAGPISVFQWTLEDKELLSKLIKEGLDIDRVVSYFPGRSYSSIREKYIRMCSGKPLGSRDPKGLEKGRGKRMDYTPEEDEIIKKLREMTPPTSWEKIAQQLGNGRHSAPIAKHYKSRLSDHVAGPTPVGPGRWTEAEVVELKGYMRDGLHTAEAAAKLGRSEGAVKRRILWIKHDPDYSGRGYVEGQGRNRRWSAEQIEEVRALSRPDMHQIVEIAKRTGRSAQAVRRMWWLHHAKGVRRSEHEDDSK